ncbi:lactococcin 972 family bacteriocin [Leifsonia sp. LS1]|uniref:lactococcin 972 family bacteriocin n=1 Tax=Leifsonia sp. LS1 TaxID=2828483 RepID=UPI001CFE8D06|nr:lactococcin 972 family bacteriocin [Leifsonia sp. LS1]
MRLKKSLIATALAAGVLTGGTLLSAAPANAYVSYPEGGTWDYGNSGSTWSHYHHPSKVHRSTACNSYTCLRSADAGRGSWSRATVAWTVTGNTWYYDNY